MQMQLNSGTVTDTIKDQPTLLDLMLTDVSLGLLSTLSYSGEESPQNDATMQKTRTETGKRLSPDDIICVPGFSCLSSGNSVLCDEKQNLVYIHWNWDSEACEQKSSVIPADKDDPCALPQVDLGLALGPNNRTQGELQVFKPVIPDWASSTSSPWRKGSESPGPYDL